jgi:hypothetical protein
MNVSDSPEVAVRAPSHRRGVGRLRRRTPAEEARRRSNPRRRRVHLRDLDLVFGKELRDAGTLSCDELATMSAEPLGGIASQATIVEWWEYAYRRGWLEQHGDGRCRLTQAAEQALWVARRRASGPDYMSWSRGLLKWLTATGLVGVLGLLAHRDLSIAAWIFVWVIAGAVGFALVALLSRLIEPWMDRSDGRTACDWLDGRAIRLGIELAPAPVGPVKRVYADSELQAPGHTRQT